MDESAQDFCEKAASHCLAGYQILEESLKTYLTVYYRSVKVILQGKLYFGFDGEDFKQAPLGRLVEAFSKACDDADLVRELRSVKSHRDEVAHRAFLAFYGGERSPLAYHELALDFHDRSGQIVSLIHRVNSSLGSILLHTDSE